jgi:hypothetical protein
MANQYRIPDERNGILLPSPSKRGMTTDAI